MSFAARRPEARRRTPSRAAVRPVAVATAEGAPATYVGLVTRALAFALDTALINLVAIVTSAAVALAFSVLHLPEDLEIVAFAVGGAAYLLWVVGYFVTFWATTGQTPGSRVLRIRVRPASGEPRLLPRRALLRFAGLTLCALPLFAGFLWILVDDRRRGPHDIMARTVVVDAGEDRPRTRAAQAPPVA